MSEEEFELELEDEDEEEWDDEDEEERETGADFSVVCFFHTGSSLQLTVPGDTTARALRRFLTSQNRETYGSTMLVNGVQITPEYEDEHYLNPGDMVFFTGSVKGGAI